MCHSYSLLTEIFSVICRMPAGTMAVPDSTRFYASDIYHIFDQDEEISPKYQFDDDKDMHESCFEVDLFYGKLRTIRKEDVV